MLVTAVTALVMPSQLILFGILHCLGVAMMLYPLLAPLVERLPVWAGVLLSAALYLLTAGIGQRVLRLWSLYRPPAGCPLRLWFSLPAGAAPAHLRLGRLLPTAAVDLPLPGRRLPSVAGSKTNGVPETFCRSHLPALQWVGRHALPIYLLHQPLAYAAVWVVASLL